MFTITEICNLLDVSVETVRRWIRSGDLTAEKNGKSYLVKKSDLKNYLSKKHSQNSPLLKVIEEKKGTELVQTYMEKVNGLIGREENKGENTNTSHIQEIYRVEEQILKYEQMIHEYKAKILSLKKEAINIKKKLI
ncbi:helix-turn-helix domain-containing protein [Terribacillus saccharophilus]|uniref:helix-turn-helix domain-containing protein n=1 Tax=Terribacillus saccharophilus TaxID=361277 RepID=UPI0039827665